MSMSMPSKGSSPSSGLQIRPLSHPAGSQVDFGAEVSACDLQNLSDAQFAELERAVLTHQVVVVRGQAQLPPRAQFELTRRFDPTVQTYGHGHNKELLKKSVLVQDLVSIPAVPQVQLLGNGRVQNHQGIAEVELRHPSHQTFHRTPLSAEQEASEQTRFYRWHIDAALYKLNPPKVTTLLALQVPENRTQTVRYDDDSDDVLTVPLGTTAFVSGYQAFQALTPAQQFWALRTQVRYAPRPYVWIRNARAHSTGLGLVSEDMELAREQLPEFELEHITTLPMVWLNPLARQPALQVRVRSFISRNTPVLAMLSCQKRRERSRLGAPSSCARAAHERAVKTRAQVLLVLECSTPEGYMWSRRNER